MKPRTNVAQDAEIERLTATALGARTELASLSHKAQAYASQARVVESIKKPQVGFVGGFTYLSDTHLASQDYWSGSLAATWLLFDGHHASHKAEALRLKECQTMRQRNDTASKIAFSVRSSWLSLRSSIAALEVAKAATVQADENLRQTTKALSRASRDEHGSPRRGNPSDPNVYRLLQFLLFRP